MPLEAQKKQDILTYSRGLFFPLVKFCLRHSIKLQDLIEILKELFIEAAAELLDEKNLEASASKIAVVTGVHRKDIAKHRSGILKSENQKNPISKIINRWREDKRFSNKKGPKALTYEGVNSEFAELVKSETGGDLSFYAVIMELERMGVVDKNEDTIALKSIVVAPKPEVKEGIEILSKDVEDLVCTVEENIFNRNKIPNLHLKTEFDNVSLAELPAIRTWLLEEGSAFHERLRKYLSTKDLDLNQKIKAPGGGRVAVGVFSRMSQKNN